MVIIKGVLLLIILIGLCIYTIILLIQTLRKINKYLDSKKQIMILSILRIFLFLSGLCMTISGIGFAGFSPRVGIGLAVFGIAFIEISILLYKLKQKYPNF